MTFEDVKYLVTQSFTEWSEDKASRLSAALAYYTIFSVPPLLILILAIAARFFERSTLQTQIINQVSGLIGENGAQAIETILENASQPEGATIATIVSIITLLLGASGVFGQLQDALNTIWEVQPDPTRGIWGTIQARFFSFAMVVSVGFLLMVSLVVSSVLAAFNEFVTDALPGLLILAQLINFIVSFGVITVLFAMVYKYVPDVKIAWKDVWIGATVTALLFTIGKWAIGLYLGNSAPGSTYGAAGSLIVLLVWIYYSAQILFLGAEFTQVYANKYGSRIVADEDAISLTPQDRQKQGIPRSETVEKAHQAQQRERATAVPPPTPLATPASYANHPIKTPAEILMERFHHYLVSLLAVGVAFWRLINKRDR